MKRVLILLFIVSMVVGSIHYYKKEGKIMSLVFQEHIFDVFEMSDEVKM